MKNRVLIHVDSLRRDGAACITLAEILRARGVDVVISGQETTSHYLKFWRPHLMLHTSASKIDGYNKLGIISCDKRPIIHYLPQEGRPTKPQSVKLSYQRLKDTDFCLIDRIYVWNKVHHDWLLKNSSLSPDQIQIVGGYRLDLAKYGTPANMRERPPVVGFIGRFTALSPHDGDYGLHLTAKTKPALWHKLPKITAQVRASMIYSYVMHTLIEETDYTISLRPHHNEYPHGHFYTWAKKQFGDRIEIDSSLSFYEWAAGKLALVSTASSTFAEVTIARTPLICIDHIEGHEVSWDHDQGSMQIRDLFKGQRLPHSFEELAEALEQLRKDFEPAPIEPTIKALIKEQYMWPHEGSSLLTIANGIQKALECMDSKQRSKRPILPKLSGDISYARGMWKYYRAGVLPQRLSYIFNDRLHGGDALFREIAARITKDKPYKYSEKNEKNADEMTAAHAER